MNFLLFLVIELFRYRITYVSLHKCVVQTFCSLHSTYGIYWHKIVYYFFISYRISSDVLFLFLMLIICISSFFINLARDLSSLLIFIMILLLTFWLLVVLYFTDFCFCLHYYLQCTLGIIHSALSSFLR